ncbi:MAG: enoyl-CoA hydratase/isomerase family protein [Neisseriaceae bacterium]|nr:enoyl-CoA hydratase/isomerase family protein [Neisseriaceae bacterium]
MNKPHDAQPEGLLQHRLGRVLVLTLNRPQQRNALSASLRQALWQALLAAEEHPEISAVVLTGAGGMFCAGGDLRHMPTTVMAGRQRMQQSARLMVQLTQMNKPVVAAIEGWAMGAGWSLALACDCLVAADNAQFGSGFGQVGLLPDLGLLHTLLQRVSMATARRLLLFGEVVSGAEAAPQGLVDFVTQPTEALVQAVAKAEWLSQQAPLPLAMLKQTFAQGLEATLMAEITQQSALFVSADHHEGKQAFFAKRPPIFKGH